MYLVLGIEPFKNIKKEEYFMRFKDSGILLKDIKSDLSNEILGNKNDFVIIEKWISKNRLIVTDTKTKQTFNINFNDININYPDVTELLLTNLIINENYPEKELITLA